MTVQELCKKIDLQDYMTEGVCDYVASANMLYIGVYNEQCSHSNQCDTS